jgi:hypothetical protein
VHGINIISVIGKERLRHVGHVGRVPEDRAMRKVLKNIPERKGVLESQETDGLMMIKMI